MEQLLAVDKYKLCLATRACERFAGSVNSPDYIFSTVDTTSDKKVLKTTTLAFRNLIDIQCQYKILGGEEKHKDSLADVAMAMIDHNYTGMKDVCKNKKVVSHRAYAAKIAYVS
ncbi:hypothetical protein D1007_43843 [Hordeum vulgare]|nr:hypothetical protein D1007_43843 [Hordeum vulgare]